MKPVFLCGACRKEAQWGDRFCGHCGKPIEWPLAGVRAASGATSAHVPCPNCGTENDPANSVCASCGKSLGRRQSKPSDKDRREQSPNKAESKPPHLPPVTFSWKMAAGFVLFLGGGVLLLELLTAQRIDPVAQNMQALPQIEELERKVAANPDDQATLLQLANLLHDSRFYDRAIQRYTVYLEKHPDDANARVDMGICYFDSGNLEEAKQQMQRALKSEPRHALAHFNLGIVFLREGDVKTANEWFRKTIELDPTGAAGQRAKRFLDEHSTL
jgi:TolA-binding protein